MSEWDQRDDVSLGKKNFAAFVLYEYVTSVDSIPGSIKPFGSKYHESNGFP